MDVDDLTIKVAIEFGGRKKVRAVFTLNGEEYWLAITDPEIEEKYRASEVGLYEIGPAKLCISLGEPYDGYAYKLVAAIVLPS